MRRVPVLTVVAAMAGLLALAPTATAQSSDDLAKQLSNPVSSLISVPIQTNFEFGGGPDGDGFAFIANIQPVAPISISDDWTMISRTIVPISYHDYLPPPDGSKVGLGDITQSLFFSPKHPGPSGIIWAVGPAILLPTATDELLGTGKFGLGPTAVVLKQTGPWTVGALANQIWSIGGDSGRADVSALFLQPFLAYSLGKGRTLSFNAETSYDWESEQWTVPINLGVSQVFKVGSQMMSAAIGAKVYAEAPSGAPDWGIRATLTYLFPTK